jgi:NAD-dependent DNA ligase
MVIPNLGIVHVKAPINIPTLCPCCGATLERSGRDLICPNLNCTVVEEASVYRLTELIKVDGLGGTAYTDLFTANSVTDWESAEALKNPVIPELGPATVTKLKTSLTYLNGILDKGIRIGDVLYLANLPKVGSSSLDRLEGNTTPEEFLEVVKSGEVPDEWIGRFPSDNGFYSFRDNLTRVQRISKFFNYNFCTIVPAEQIKTVVKFCITGPISDKRDNIIKKYAPYGAEFTSVSAADVLVCNVLKGSSKEKDAIRRGIPIMTEGEFCSKYGITV